MTTLLGIGSGDDEVVDHADWVEATALIKPDGSASREDLARALQQARGGSTSASRARQCAEDAFNELVDRQAACSNYDSAGNYPFELSSDYSVLRMRRSRSKWTKQDVAYLFLLGISRWSMSSKKRVQGEVEPTKLFELLCADVLREFWGGPSRNCNSFVFRSAPRSHPLTHFMTNIAKVCEHLGEGDISDRPGPQPGAGDGKLDLVVWRRFNDKREGSLTGFAQCKTGVHWRNHLSELQPSAFCQKYLRNGLAVTPVRIFMVPNRISAMQWTQTSIDAGLLFDRCRLSAYSATISGSVVNDCRRWLRAVISASKEIA